MFRAFILRFTTVLPSDAYLNTVIVLGSSANLLYSSACAFSVSAFLGASSCGAADLFAGAAFVGASSALSLLADASGVALDSSAITTVLG